jgi:hypothetical protein
MRVCGFTFIRNAIKFDYPVAEAIRSILPVCDEVLVAVGQSDDATLELIQSIDRKITIIQTTWDENLKEGGKVLADETNKAFRAIDSAFDWCFYIQGDEVLHEKYIAPVKRAMAQYNDDDRVDGLLFKYLHFYGSYDYLGNSSNWYRHEIRVIRNKKNIYSYRDAQGFRKNDNEKLDVKLIDAYIYHYGWVREPGAMQAKFNNFGKYWLGDEWSEMAEKTFAGEFDYTQVDSVEKFTGTHPAVMKERITRMNWKFERDLSYNKLKPKEKFKRLVEKLTGRRPFEYKNYRVI